MKTEVLILKGRYYRVDKMNSYKDDEKGDIFYNIDGEDITDQVIYKWFRHRDIFEALISIVLIICFFKYILCEPFGVVRTIVTLCALIGYRAYKNHKQYTYRKLG